MPGLISGVDVKVENASSVGVADGGNQIMVEVGSGVSVEMGVSVGGIDSTGRQALKIIVMVRRMIFSAKQYPLRQGECFVAPRNDGWCIRLME
jgi:hypothetical protein